MIKWITVPVLSAILVLQVVNMIRINTIEMDMAQINQIQMNQTQDKTVLDGYVSRKASTQEMAVAESRHGTFGAVNASIKQQQNSPEIEKASMVSAEVSHDNLSYLLSLQQGITDSITDTQLAEFRGAQKSLTHMDFKTLVNERIHLVNTGQMSREVFNQLFM